MDYYACDKKGLVTNLHNYNAFNYAPYNLNKNEFDLIYTSLQPEVSSMERDLYNRMSEFTAFDIDHFKLNQEDAETAILVLSRNEKF